jgi:anti-sigma factor RsiW
VTSEQARALFDAVVDGELAPDERQRFDAALATDAALREEFGRYRQMLSAASQLTSTPPVDLLSQVQAELRSRSGGRFYRDRFAEHAGRRGTLTWVLAACTLALLVVVVWFLLRNLG